VKTFSLTRIERPTDAIVVLTGGRGRVEEGIRLYRDGQARWLLLSGVDPAVKRSDLYRERRDEGLADGILLEKTSKTTLENALYARDLLTSRSVHSIQLITSRYHMQRAQLLFRQLLPKGVAIYPYPVESRNLLAAWWRQPIGLRLLFTECYKYWLFRCFFLFTGELAAAPLE
jgi:uncharacterized SAM-binding protein YcdF (DUF218 family)